MSQYTQEQIINGIFQGDQGVFDFIYREYYDMIERLVINKGGNRDRAKDIFQEAMYIICTKIKQERLVLTCSFSTYLYAICKNLWYHSLRKNKEYLTAEYPESLQAHEPGIDETITGQMMDLLKKHMGSLTDDCRKLLELHFRQMPLNDIRRIMGYSSEHYAADRKYKCKQSLIKKIRKDPQYKRILDGLS